MKFSLTKIYNLIYHKLYLKYGKQAINKPSSIPACAVTIIFLGVQSPECSSDTTRKVGGTTFNPSLFGLCSGWGLPSQPVTKLLVSSYLTFPPLPLTWRFPFLWHFPKVTPRQTLSGILPYGAGSSSSPMDSQPSFILASIQFIIASLFVARKCNIIRKEIILFCKKLHRNRYIFTK